MSWLHPPTSNHKLCFVTATLTSWHHIQPCLEFLIWSNSRNTFQTQKKCWRQEKFSDSCHWSSWLNHLDDEDDLLLTVISVSGWWTVSTLYWTLLDTGHHSSTLLHCGHCTSVSWPGTQQSIPRLPTTSLLHTSLWNRFHAECVGGESGGNHGGACSWACHWH